MLHSPSILPPSPTRSPPGSKFDHLRSDVISGFLVFLIAMPLCLGIAMASGFPPISGIITAVVGGLITTWFGSARLSIKGPAAGLIVIALGAVQELGAGNASLGYRRALATIVVAGVIQVGFALLRAGALGDFFPSAAVHGMLAAIGIIICSKQAHTLLGVTPHGKGPIALILEIPNSIVHANPEIAMIGIVGLVVLFGHQALRSRTAWARRIPAPMVVLAMAVPLAFFFDLDHQHRYSVALFHSAYTVGPDYLVNLPAHLLSAVTTPDFSAIGSLTSLEYVTMFALVGSIESLLSAKALDSLDPYRRNSDLDKDLLATGIGNVMSGMIGGLPMITELVRSSANIGYGAQSKLSNFFHAVFLVVFIVFAPGLVHSTPLAALAAMLIFTGVRLASPTEFVRTFRVGREQLFVLVATTLVTLATDLLVGVASGIVLELVFHLAHGAPLRSLFKPEITTTQSGDRTILTVRHAAVFTTFLSLRRQLAKLTDARTVAVDFAHTRLVDHTVMEKLHAIADDWKREGRSLEIRGLDAHRGLSDHALAARKRVRLDTPVANARASLH